MAYNDIIKELRKKLTDSREENDKMLKAEGEKYAKAGDFDGLKAVGELLMENMPEERRIEIERITHIDGMNLQEYYEKIVDLINQNKKVEALPLAEKLYKKIILEYAETEKAKFVSLRNPFEDNLCQLLFKQGKTLNRTPFDFAEYITTYGFLLVDTGATIEAIPVLEKASQYNPVDPGPKFELAEIYKIIRNKKKLFDVTRETLAIASSPVAIARCYANIGYVLAENHEFDDAAAFYIASVMFAPNPAIPLEMQHLADMKGSPIVRPSNEKIAEVMKKHNIEFGPDKNVIACAAQLSQHFLDKKDLPNALNALKITFNLTRDEQIKNLILRLDPNSAVAVPKPEKDKD